MAPRRGYSLPPTANLVNGFGQMQGRRMGVNAISRDSLLNLGTPRDPVPPPKAAKTVTLGGSVWDSLCR